jgi:hypothetical protein
MKLYASLAGFLVLVSVPVVQAQSGKGNESNVNFSLNQSVLDNNNGSARLQVLNPVQQRANPAQANLNNKFNPSQSNQADNSNIQLAQMPDATAPQALSAPDGNGWNLDLAIAMPKMKLHVSAPSLHKASHSHYDFSKTKLHHLMKLEGNRVRKMKNRKKKVKVRYERCFAFNSVAFNSAAFDSAQAPASVVS